MSVIIGSARIDERGTAHGGAAGDQKQTAKPDYKGEVSMQSFYVSSKGWYIYRAKKVEHANKLAKAMKRACNNKHIGYDQYQRDNIIKDHTDSKVNTECDCSSLVRECIIEATGKDPGNIRTVSMPQMLPKTGLFKDVITYKSGTTLYTGDILVTKTSGHTVIVVEGKARGKNDTTPTEDDPVKEDTPKKTTFSIGDKVKFTGRTHYSSSDATATGYGCKPGKAKVTHLAPGKAHPYHVQAVAGGGSNVYGWVNAGDISAL